MSDTYPVVVVAGMETSVHELADAVGVGEGRIGPIRSLGLSPVSEMILTGTLTVSGLANLVVALYRSFRSGVLIQERDGQVIITAEEVLPRGVTVIRTRGGDIEVRDSSKLFNTLVHLLSTKH